MNKIAYMTCVLSLAFTMQACDDFLDSFPQDTVRKVKRMQTRC